MKRILLPTDFSENAFNAIRYAMQLFRDDDTTFYLLNTFTPVSYNVGYLVETPVPYDFENIALMNSKKQIEETEKRIKKEFKNPRHNFIQLSALNTLVGEIKEVVDKYMIDCIIMGTKGATGAKEIFIGTHTMYTIKNAKCPVIAVPDGFEYEKPKDVLFATDYKVKQDNAFLPFLKEICDRHLCRMNILNAYYGVALEEHQQETKQFLDEYFKSNAHVFHLAEGVDVLEAIEDFQVKYKINLLVMIHNKHSFFENLLFKPVIHQIAYHTNVPFLVIPSKKRME
ncbi:universal stress protein, UspA family [Aquimarina aggregata]|uniref:Universal stress protein, UspA family n=1 Tax=Aquimarina aggregata TaxID=1642818 RepID=A0A162ZSM1_9FLAO|nr:universal stress protein [Aquimarina aggregata]KZS40000.1 universal stress protein, UspA family [Aquimarina aggregata]